MGTALRYATLISTALAALVTATASATTTTTDVVANMAPPESSWGRIYVRDAPAPMQYIRDSFGGAMPTRELIFQAPERTEDRYGCAPLPDHEAERVLRDNGHGQGNHSVALVVDRGECSFELKARVAQAMGAAALVVVSHDESVHRPVALVDDGEIAIASVMVRRSAGLWLRAAVHSHSHSDEQSQGVRGRLVPIVCEHHPFQCHATTAVDTKYIGSHTLRSGVIQQLRERTESKGHNEGHSVGEFLSATYGGVLPTQPLRVVLPHADHMQGCAAVHTTEFTADEETHDHLDKEPEQEQDHGLADALVVLTRSSVRADCSVLEQVSYAQRQGAAAVVVALASHSHSDSQSEDDDDHTEPVTAGLTHASVDSAWHAYNITIAAATVTDATYQALVAMATTAGHRVVLRQDNSIAEAWAAVRRLATPSAWPPRRQRRESLVQRLLTTLPVVDGGQRQVLKHYFVAAAGGSSEAWDRLMRVNAARAEPVVADGDCHNEL